MYAGAFLNGPLEGELRAHDSDRLRIIYFVPVSVGPLDPTKPPEPLFLPESEYRWIEIAINAGGAPVMRRGWYCGDIL